MRQRRKPLPSLPNRVKILFHGVGGEPVLPKKVNRIEENPPIYLVDDFLTEKEIQHLTDICCHYKEDFVPSYTENNFNEEVLSEYRTSKFIYLSKGQDTIVRKVESKAANLVGLSEENIEPLQIVSYSDGQMFDIHHDAGTLLEDGTVDLVQPRRIITLFLVCPHLALS